AAASKVTQAESVVRCKENLSSFAHWKQTPVASVMMSYFHETVTRPWKFIVNGTCVENAEPEVPEKLPMARCTHGGSWYIVHGCECRAGFEIIDGSCRS
ncbi:hypothetical protein PENTCL1PPCAC_24410, partial [Pristionchus entomophagus]